MSSNSIYSLTDCRICGSKYESLRSLSKHFCQSHNYTPQAYYDQYFKKPNEGFCLECSSVTKFRGIGDGYNTFCGNKCQAIHNKRKLKQDSEKYGLFIERTRSAVVKIWSTRTYEEKLEITKNARKAAVNLANSLDEQGRKKTYSRYYKCNEETIKRLNRLGREQLLSNMINGLSGNSGKYMNGKFKPRNPEKYAGNADYIFYRSSWELRCMSHFDRNVNVIQWASEELIIPYFDPVSNKPRRYFPDFVIKSKNKDGLIETIVIEVKPLKETTAPKPIKNPNKSKRYLTEVAKWGTNSAKFTAANKYCEEKGWKFVIVTEKDLGI